MIQNGAPKTDNVTQPTHTETNPKERPRQHSMALPMAKMRQPQATRVNMHSKHTQQQEHQQPPPPDPVLHAKHGAQQLTLFINLDIASLELPRRRPEALRLLKALRYRQLQARLPTRHLERWGGGGKGAKSEPAARVAAQLEGGRAALHNTTTIVCLFVLSLR